MNKIIQPINFIAFTFSFNAWFLLFESRNIMYTAKTTNKIIPSSLDSECPKNINTNGKAASKSMNHELFLDSGSDFNPLARMIAMPPTKVRSAILLPMTVPKANAEFPCVAEVIPIKSSGMLVETAIKIKLRTNSLILKAVAMIGSVLTRIYPPVTNTKQDTKNSNKSMNKAILTKNDFCYFNSLVPRHSC